MYMHMCCVSTYTSHAYIYIYIYIVIFHRFHFNKKKQLTVSDRAKERQRKWRRMDQMNGVVLVERSKCRTNPASMISIRAVIDVLMENINNSNKDDNININWSIIPLLHFDPLVLSLLSDYSFSRRSEDPIVDAFDPLSTNCLDFLFPCIYIFIGRLGEESVAVDNFFLFYIYIFSFVLQHFNT